MINVGVARTCNEAFAAHREVKCKKTSEVQYNIACIVAWLLDSGLVLMQKYFSMTHNTHTLYVSGVVYD